MTPPATSGSPESVIGLSDHSEGITELQNAVIRFAGNSQDGIQTIGGFLARLAGRSAREVMTYMTIPSTISGGLPSSRSIWVRAKSFPQGMSLTSFSHFINTATTTTSVL